MSAANAKIRDRADRVVWVLGSGFSKALGGPLLNDLFVNARRAQIESKFAGPPYLGLQVWLDPLHKLYAGRHIYRAFDDEAGDPPMQPPWENAEEFLEWLDTAAQVGGENDGPEAQARTFFKAIVDNTRLDDLSDWCRVYLAAACHSFIHTRAASYERWQPFCRWAQQLDERDTVISFNYDRVVETADTSILATLPFAQAPPGESVAEAQTPQRGRSAPRLLKLHGSVDWALRSKAEHRWVERSSAEALLVGGGYPPAIATPGPSKLNATDSLFKDLWAMAETALREADVVAFIGYRFPETDATAKRRLLGAIGANANDDVTIRIVLGPPDRSASDVARLVGMLLGTEPWTSPA